ncbi:MAG: repeat:TPR repeat [Dehalococcoidia bacterium]|nr:repeat:TPR repeat [Dehalococcoidia bacterium]
MVTLITHGSKNIALDAPPVESIPLNMGYSKIRGLGELSSIKPKCKLPKGIELFNKLKQLIIKGDESFDNGDYLEAEKAYKAALTQAELLTERKLIASCCNLIGACLGSRGRHEDAMVYFGKAVELDPEYVAAWWNQTIALGNLGKDAEALTCLDRILALGAENADAWHIKGIIQYNLQRYKQALESFNKALELVPNSGIAWLNKGLTLLRLERFEEATTAFEQAYRFPEMVRNSKTELYTGWSYTLLFGALQAQLAKDLDMVEYWADYWGDVKERSKEDGLAPVMEERITMMKEKLPEKELRAFFKIEKKLHRMEDPLYRLKALRDSISRKWPKGLSAVEAIREDRD